MNNAIINYINYHPVRTQRGLEIFTGAFSWFVIIFLVAGSFFVPQVIAYIVLGFNVYWFYRSITMAVNAVAGYLNLRATEKIDWYKKLRTEKVTTRKWQSIYHVVLVCNVKEPMPTLRRTLDALAAQNLPTKQLIVVLAMEAREAEGPEKAKVLISEYSKRFGRIMATFHPIVPGETVGKHSNECYAAKEVKRKLVDEEKMPVENITLTTADADSCLPPQYFSLLTYRFLTVGKPYLKFFQAPLFAFNNLDRVPAMTQIMEIASGISQISGLQKYSKRYYIVSTYTMSLKLLDEINYWDLDVIPEDWHLNLKAYFATSGRAELVPLFLPISIDAAESTTGIKTLHNRYQQSKRQAWGVTDVPYSIKQFFLHPEIPLFDRILKVSFVLESHFVWPINWFLITIGANIPVLLNPAFARTTLGYNLPRISGFVLTLCLVGLIAMIFVNTMLDPRKQRKTLAFLHPMVYLRWLFMPVAGFFLGALPGLESHTRLMLGKYIEYRVTEKV